MRTTLKPSLVATASRIEIGLNEAAAALREIKEILDDEGELPRRILQFAIEGAYERVDAAALWLDRLPAGNRDTPA